MACNTAEGAASKAAVVFSSLSFILTLLAMAVPWLQAAAAAAIAGGYVAVWPFGAIACGGVLFVGGACTSVSVAYAFRSFPRSQP